MLWESSIGGVIFWVPLRIVTNHYSLFGSSCLLYGRRWDDSTQSLGAGIRFSVGVALSSHLFVLFLLFQLYEDLYDDNTAPQRSRRGFCVWFAIDLSFLDVVFSFIVAIMRYLSLSLDEMRALFSLSLTLYLHASMALWSLRGQ